MYLDDRCNIIILADDQQLFISRYYMGLLYLYARAALPFSPFLSPPPLSFETASLRTTTTSTLRPRENLSSSPSIDSTTNSTSSAALDLYPPTVNRLVFVTRYTLFLHSMPPCLPRPLRSFPCSATLSSYNRNLSPATAIAIKYKQPSARHHRML